MPRSSLVMCQHPAAFTVSRDLPKPPAGPSSEMSFNPQSTLEQECFPLSFYFNGTGQIQLHQCDSLILTQSHKHTKKKVIYPFLFHRSGRHVQLYNFVFPNLRIFFVRHDHSIMNNWNVWFLKSQGLKWNHLYEAKTPFDFRVGVWRCLLFLPVSFHGPSTALLFQHCYSDRRKKEIQSKKESFPQPDMNKELMPTWRDCFL